MDEKQRLLKLQENLESGAIFEEDLSKKDIEALEKLYQEQINLLKEMQEVYKKKLEYHKKNISTNLNKIKKLNSKN